jgi:hypothetical protein
MKFFFQICHPFLVTTFYVDVAFIIVTVDFYKMEPFRFDITYKLIFLFAVIERKKERKKVLPFVEFFNCHFRVLMF